MDFGCFAFLSGRLSELWLRTGEHILLTGLSTGMALLIGLPLGVLAYRVLWLRGPLLGTIGVLQTIPSLAMLAILLALFQKIGAIPAVIALVLYALLPIVRNTLAGLEGVSAETKEAARGIGMTDRQQLLWVDLPLATPVIIAGIRTAAVVGVGIATLSAFIGAGGLGQFINRGLALSSTPLILLGAIPAALLALVVDFSLAAFEWGRRPRRQAERKPLDSILRPVAFGLPVLVLLAGLLAYSTAPGSSRRSTSALTKRPIRIATKNFTEQILLGELMAQVIESRALLPVERRFNLGGTMICHGALVSGEIDLYAEYSGTALTAILNLESNADSKQVLDVIGTQYRNKFDCEWLAPFGFNNTYTLTVRQETARTNGWITISDLEESCSQLRAGFTSEFAERSDGYPGLVDVYGFGFGEVRDLEPSLMYEAIRKGEVDVVCAFATDGRIPAYELQPLKDDRQFFPPYEAAPVVRTSLLQTVPALRDALNVLVGVLDDATMQRLNYEVDENKRDPAAVVRSFLASLHPLEDNNITTASHLEGLQ